MRARHARDEGSTPEFEAYIADMLWAQDYARANRDQMMDTAMREVFSILGFGPETHRINCHHNFTEHEDHRGRRLWITRKGAIKADVPSAYKDIDQVIADQADLVEVLHTLHLVLNYKGT